MALTTETKGPLLQPTKGESGAERDGSGGDENEITRGQRQRCTALLGEQQHP
jgi:hypothetical protein